MGIMVYSLLWVMQDLHHQTYVLGASEMTQRPMIFLRHLWEPQTHTPGLHLRRSVEGEGLGLLEAPQTTPKAAKALDAANMVRNLQKLGIFWAEGKLTTQKKNNNCRISSTLGRNPCLQGTGEAASPCSRRTSPHPLLRTWHFSNRVCPEL